MIRQCKCGASLYKEHILGNLVGIQKGLSGEKFLILYNCRCRTTLAMHYNGAPDDIQRAADQIPLH